MEIRRLLSLLAVAGLGSILGVPASGSAQRAPQLVPTVLMSTFLGGAGYDRVWGAAANDAGDFYVAGQTDSADFPVTAGAFQTQFHGGGMDGFVAKFDHAGRLLWSTYLGGTDWDLVFGMTVDAAGDAVVTGVTASTDFPVTPKAVQSALAGGDDAFVTVFRADGSGLDYSTYLGGKQSDGVALPVNPYHVLPPADDFDIGLAAAVGPGGDIYLAGETNSIDLPVTSGAPQTLIGGQTDAFVVRIDPAAGQLVSLTYHGGGTDDWCSGIAVDSAGDAFVIGSTQSPNFPVTPGAFQLVHTVGTAAFVSKLDPAGSAWVYSTLLSGTQGSSAGSGTNHTGANALAIDAQGHAYVVGDTNDTDFPVTPGVVQPANHGIDDGFVTELAPDGASLVFSTYLGGTDYDGLYALARMPDGSLLATWFSSSATFGQEAPLFQTSFGGVTDAWTVELSGDGKTLLRSSFLGGGDQEYAYGLALSHGRIAVAGVTPSTDFPVTPGAAQTTYGGGVAGDAFVTVASLSPTAAVVRFSVHRPRHRH